MADATISKIYPALNKKRGGSKHFTFAIEGTNLGNTTEVEAILNGYKWEIDVRDVHSSTILLVKLKRKAGGPDTKKEDEGTRQIEQITVTVTNPGQTTPGKLENEKVATYALP